MRKLLIAACILTLSAAAAHAAPTWPNWYVGLNAGVTFLDDQDISGGVTGNADSDAGWAGAVSLGYAPPSTMQPFSNMRFEAELGYHFHGLDSLVLSGTPTATNGDIKAMSYMGNLYYDFRNESGWTPYLGAGAGGARVMLSKNSGIGNTDRQDNVFAYQFMAGVFYAPRSMPMTEWGIGYRYFVAQDPEFASATTPIKLDDFTAHSVELGARFRF